MHAVNGVVYTQEGNVYRRSADVSKGAESHSITDNLQYKHIPQQSRQLH